MQRQPLLILLAAATLVVVTAGMLSPRRTAPYRLPDYRFVVTPGDDPGALRLDLPDARMVEVDRAGDLIVQRSDTATHASRPRAYQRIDGVRRDVDVRFVLDANGDVRFAVGAYDRQQPLVIDPRR